MAELYPLPLGLHLRRIVHELRRQNQIYDLPASKFWRPKAGRDLSVRFHGMPAGTAFGPAAGPQDQLIQNILLSWLGGSRIVELKTVQIMDDLKISRPCIYAGNVGFNVEWSQELKVDQSLTEYVASSMLIDILTHSGLIDFGSHAPGSTDTIFDLSVGYDLKGISSPKVRSFIDSCLNAEAVIDRLREEIPSEFAQYRDIPFKKEITKSITLSTFHGCPKDEIEKIGAYLLSEVGVHTVIKLNPTQLDRKMMEDLFNGQMGYSHLTINPKAWETSLSLDEAVGIVERLEPLAKSKGLNVGVKFSNTLEVLNTEKHLPDEVMYMSGPPLHVIAMTLVEEWRKRVGDRFPITFAAGIDRENFPDAMALGLTPITACTDLLKTRGYARQTTYLMHLEEKMEKLGAANIDDWILSAYQKGSSAVDSAIGSHPLAEALKQGEDGNWTARLNDFIGKNPEQADSAKQLFGKAVRQAALLNTPVYGEAVRANKRYTYANNKVAPKKVGSALYLVDCLACGKCVPVCPNDANFTYDVSPADFEGRNYKVVRGHVLPEEQFTLKVRKGEQWAVYADFCNECGNCDTYCPEDGGPYAQKPKFFGDIDTFRTHSDRDGFHVERSEGRDRVWARFRGLEYFLEIDTVADSAIFTDHIIELSLDRKKPNKPKQARIVETGREGHVLDMKLYFWMEKCLEGVMNPSRLNYVNVRFLSDEQLAGAGATASSGD